MGADTAADVGVAATVAGNAAAVPGGVVEVEPPKILCCGPAGRVEVKDLGASDTFCFIAASCGMAGVIGGGLVTLGNGDTVLPGDSVAAGGTATPVLVVGGKEKGEDVVVFGVPVVPVGGGNDNCGVFNVAAVPESVGNLLCPEIDWPSSALGTGFD